jgi:hypothetical protein
MFFMLAATLLAFAATPVSEYLRRLEGAAKIAAELTEGGTEAPAEESSEETALPAPVVIAKLNAIKQLLPAREDVDTGRVVVRVDNTWLHEAADKVIKEVNGDVEQRHSMLTDIELRLDFLRERVKRGMVPRNPDEPDGRPKLDGILARAEYRPDVIEESSLKRWSRMAWEALVKLLRRIFGSRADTTSPGGGGSAFRIILVLAAAAGLLFGLYKFARFRRGRAKPEEESDAREVLGEEIADDATATDLLSDATELARRGEYRAAIRRAYIALLVEMEQRGKLRLHKSKTNRDYLNALRPDRDLFPPFSALTGTFEQIWYGEGRATESEFNEFVSRYRETANRPEDRN